VNSETRDTTGLIAGIIDVFAESPLSGNPLAVVEGADALSDAQMRRIAGEFNQAETTYLSKAGVRTGGFDRSQPAARKSLARDTMRSVPGSGLPNTESSVHWRRHAPSIRKLVMTCFRS
jgi:Phenazine biosynthesis-like protein